MSEQSAEGLRRKDKYDFVVSRAVTAYQTFVSMTLKNISLQGRNHLPTNILYQGGDIDSETGIYLNR